MVIVELEGACLQIIRKSMYSHHTNNGQIFHRI
jgi:hypothetical protein